MNAISSNLFIATQPRPLRWPGFFFAAAALLWSAVAWAQSAPVYQDGQVQPNDVPKFERNGMIRGGVSIAGDNNGMGVNPFAATDMGRLGICSNSAATSGPFSQICLGHSASGKARIEVDALGGATHQLAEVCNDGTCVDFPFSTTGVVGSNTTIASYAPLWGNLTGTLLTAGQPVGEFSVFATPPAVISRMGDRLLVGKSTNVNDGGFSSQNVTKDWLETIRVDTTSQAMIAAISQNTLQGTGGGGIAVLGAQRTSDQGTHVPSNVEAVVGFCIGDTPHTDTAGNPACWAGYFETRKFATASLTTVYGIEIDIDQKGTDSYAANPYTVLQPGGEIGINIASGAGDPAAQTATAAIMVAQNNAKWQAGIVFQPQAIVGSAGLDGDSCCANAIQLARNQAITFWASPGYPVGQQVGVIYSSAKSGTQSVNIDFISSGIQIENHQTGVPLAFLVQGNLFLEASTPPTGCGGGGPGPTVAAFTAQGPGCNQFVNLVEDVTNNKAILQVGSANSGFQITGLPSIAVGTGKHFLCIDAGTKFVYEGTGTSCN